MIALRESIQILIRARVTRGKMRRSSRGEKEGEMRPVGFDAPSFALMKVPSVRH